MAGAISALLLAVMLSGCGETEPAQGEGSGQDPVIRGETDDSLAGGTAGEPDAKGEDGTSGEPTVYYMDELYTEEADILPITQSAEARGISYTIESAEYTETFGNRNRENLSIYSSAVKTDDQGNLLGDYKYLFLTITFTNATDQTQEIYRTSNNISVIGASLNTIPWASDACYYDVDWEEGTESQKHHWKLGPGESVTSEIGWVITGCGTVLNENDTLETRMGSGGPYTLYYHVVQYDGDNEGSKFIDLGVKVE